jgi:hypothetical protein
MPVTTEFSETGHGCTSLIFSARDDSDLLYGLLDRIQDLGLHLIIPLIRPRGPIPPVGSRGLATSRPGRRRVTLW